MILLEILEQIKSGHDLLERDLEKLIHKNNQNRAIGQQYAKRQILPYYLQQKKLDPDLWDHLGIDQAVEERLFKVLRIKPRRSASGVTTITVITKPGKCQSDCLFCPNDIRMPKSYLSDEPACQRAERNYFDPYLQVAARLRTLVDMGHPTDKIELIVLGGTWTDYPEAYQTWFVKELFLALNDSDDVLETSFQARMGLYLEAGISNQADEIAKKVAGVQEAVNSQVLTYNQAVDKVYSVDADWKRLESFQSAGFDELAEQQIQNETSRHRVVGLAVEIRPDAVDPDSLRLLRRYGCTKIQMGIQSLDQELLELNNRHLSVPRISESFQLLRLFGFKIQAHFMLNLLGSSPQKDASSYLQFVTDRGFIPDEVKLYPCALVESSHLMDNYRDKSWAPYSEAELVEALATDSLNTPPFVRISRMVRDISAKDIVAGNKKTNLRQMVEKKLLGQGVDIPEIRFREIGSAEVLIEDLDLQTISYDTTVTTEYFLQWVTDQGRIAGFLRLSLPRQEYVVANQGALPVGPFQAMIREVHVYGQVAPLSRRTYGVQHFGLGRSLIEKACQIAKTSGYRQVNVISSVGTREYYRNLGFVDDELYQVKSL